MGELVVVDCEEDLGMEEVEKMEEEEEEREMGVVRWEEYLPRMVIRVLLVEADDSTRQIIAALLRKCNYKVAAIPDGLKAWEILKQNHSNIDLILTEVDLPSISGYALLTLIMEHDGCKKIPVIMMSSSDSISTVFKCMLKGAADFLIKPVRRNELKNLWQHVWRRISQANNASGVQNLCGDHCKAETSSKNRGTRNCSDDNVSSSKEKCQSPEKATDAQGLLQMKHHGTSSLSHNDVLQHEEGMRLEEETDEGKSIRFVPSGVAHGNEAYASTSRLERVGSSSGRMAQVERSEPATSGNMDGMPNGELSEHTGRAIDLIGTINNNLECTQEQFTSSCKMHNSDSTPQLELSLSRSSDRDDQKTDGKQKLNHSIASAFSRYSSNKKMRTLFPSLDNSPTEVEGGDKFLEKLVASPKPVNAFSIDEENKSTVMTSPNAHLQPTFPVPQLGLVPVPGVGYGGTFPGYGPIYPPVFTPQVSLGAVGLRPVNQKESSSLLASTSIHSDPGTYCSSMGQSGFDETSNHEEKVASVDQQKYADGTASQTANSAFRSNGHIAHLQNNAINDNANQPTVRMDNADKEHLKNSGDFMLASEQLGRAKGVLHNSQRQAALAKFKQKRKDRCFVKKVRYQSRKKLAEQRPRVKGQFVRQVQSDQPVAVLNTGHEDNG